MSGRSTGIIRKRQASYIMGRRHAAKIGRRTARLKRLGRKGLLPTKAELQQLSAEATAKQPTS